MLDHIGHNFFLQMTSNSLAFLSYARFNDRHDDGKISALRDRLSGEVEAQTGEAFDIFQDRTHISWGEPWLQRIENSIDLATFLIPIITPGFFRSVACQEELNRFIAREKKLGRKDLILPIYYITCPEFEAYSPNQFSTFVDDLISRQYFDWRTLRFDSLDSQVVRRAVASLAQELVSAINRTPKPEPGTTTSAAENSPLSRFPTVIGRPQSPRTIIVDQLHRGDFSTIEAAIKAASPGTRIILKPGLYCEPMVVDQPVEIIGGGPRSDVVVETSGRDTVLFNAPKGRLSNITLRQTGPGPFVALRIIQGRLEVDSCDISSSGVAGISIQGTADPRLKDNIIHSCKATGIDLSDYCRGTLEENVISGCNYASIQIRENSNPLVRKNRIHRAGQNGITVCNGGLGVIEDNDISGCSLAAISVKTHGDPTVRTNEIYGSKFFGILIADMGQGIFENNDIHDNGNAGVAIQTEGNPVVRSNRIHNGHQAGVLISEGGLGLIEGNDIVDNAFAGVEIRSQSRPTVHLNRISGGKRSGIFVHDQGNAVISSNEVFSNSYSGITLNSCNEVFIKDNRIRANAKHGIRILSAVRAVIENNDLRDNLKGPWQVDPAAKPSIKQEGNREHS